MPYVTPAVAALRLSGAVLLALGLLATGGGLVPALQGWHELRPHAGLNFLVSGLLLLAWSRPRATGLGLLCRLASAWLLWDGASALLAPLALVPPPIGLGPISTLTALAFFLSGIFGLLRLQQRVWPAQVLALLVFAIAWVTVLGDAVSDALPSTSLVDTDRLSPATAVGLMLLAAGLYAAGWQRGRWADFYQGRDDRRIVAITASLFLLVGLSLGVVAVGLTMHAVWLLDPALKPALALSAATLPDAWLETVRSVLWLSGLGLFGLTVLGAWALSLVAGPLVRALQRKRQQQDALLDLAPSAVIIAAANGRIEHFNREAQRLFGLGAEEARGRLLESLFDDLTVAGFLRSAHAGVQRRVRCTVRLEDGSEVAADAWIAIEFIESRRRYIVFLNDCSDMQAREDALLRLETAFMNAAWGIAMSEWRSRTFTDVNPAFARMHGYERHELVGRPIQDVFPPSAQADLSRHIQQAHLSGQYTFESLHLRKDGSEFPVRIELSVVRARDGQVRLHIANVQDITLQQQLTKRLRESEQLSRLVINVQREMVVRWTPDTTVLFANRAYADIYGETTESIVGQRWLDLARKTGETPAFVAELEAQVQDLCANPRRLELSAPVRHVSLGLLWVQWSILPLFHGNGALEGFQVTGHDITARKQAEDALLQSESWFRSVFNSMFHHALILDAHGGLHAINQNAAAFLGRPVPDLLGAPLWSLGVFAALPQARERVRQAVGDAAQGRMARFDVELPDKFGAPHVFDVMLRPVAGEGGAIDYLLLEAHDITQYRRQERALEERDAHLRTITESMPGMVFEFVRQDGTLRLIYVNQTGQALCELAPQALVAGGANLLDCIDEQARAVFFDDVLRSERTMSELDWTGRLNKGWDTWVNLRAIPRVSDKRVVWSGVALDITDIKEKELELEKSRSALRELSTRHEIVREDERRRMAREVHDELGQHLTALRMGLSVLGERAQAEELAQEARRLKTLVDSSISMVRSIVSTLRPPAMDLGIAAALRWLVHEFETHVRIACELDIHTEGIALDDATATALFRIVQESLTNVAKHAQASRVWISMRRLNRHLVLEVRDNGRGFDVAGKGRSGFGLLGMNERAISLQGELALHSVPGEGTVVSIYLPLSQQG